MYGCECVRVCSYDRNVSVNVRRKIVIVLNGSMAKETPFSLAVILRKAEKLRWTVGE